MQNEQLNMFESEYYDDPTINQSNLEDLKFKVHTSLIYKLGEELIKNEVTAISELVKNAYDADSAYVELTVNPEYVIEHNGNMLIGEIVIKDEGCGMDKRDIINGWLTLSNSAKKKMKKEKKVTKKYERMPLGDKGLGRLAVQKLGRIMIMVTKKEESDIEYTVTIPWGDFQKNTILENVKVVCTEKKVEENFEKGYTKIIIRDLVNPNLWKEEENINELERELSQTVSPFKKESNFYVFAKIGERNLDFSKISQEILDGAISKFSFEITDEHIKLKGSFKLDFFLSKNNYFDISEDHLKEFLLINKEKMNSYSLIENDLFSIEFGEEFSFDELSGFELHKDGKLMHPGKYNGKVYSYSFDENYLKGQVAKLNFKVIKGQVDFKNFIKKNYGIKVFRDDFAILPYGYGEGGDWLALNKSKGTQGSYYDLKNETVIGFIQLYGKESYKLREKTNREGLIEDDYYNNFYAINKFILKKINNHIGKLRRGFSKYINLITNDMDRADPLVSDHEVAVKSLRKISDKSQKITNSIEHLSSKTDQSTSIIAQVNKTINSIKNIERNEKALLQQLIDKLNENINLTKSVLKEADYYLKEIQVTQNHLSTIEEDYGVMVGRMQELAELAGLGILTETLTHELYTLINNTKKNTANVISYYTSNYEPDKKVQQYFNYVRYSTDAMRKQLSHLSPNFRNVRTKKDVVKISDLLRNHLEYYKERTQKNGLSINVSYENDFLVNVSIGMINQVLDNLYLNSEHWLLHAKRIGKIQDPQFFLEIKENGKIHVWDNGLGIDENIVNEVFDPFVSNKENGRGLGLYIVSQILDYHNCKIRLMRERNSFGKLYKFEIDLRKSLVHEEK
ncbi:ATP-binding protein [Neobacillus drentensis]|uniref:ATP-binding protein n=1 Tax=Neobacillus drentensis TaxID=220684 RepID=UPI002FFE2869